MGERNGGGKAVDVVLQKVQQYSHFKLHCGAGYSLVCACLERLNTVIENRAVHQFQGEIPLVFGKVDISSHFGFQFTQQVTG